MLAEFAKQHETLSSKEFKKQWETWISSNNDFISNEFQQMKQQGFMEDIQHMTNKLYVSTRYYHRKKQQQPKSSTQQQQQHQSQTTPSTSNDSSHLINKQQRKQYVRHDKHLIASMDTFISNTITTTDKPATKYIAFLKLNNMEDNKDTKKLFKNRYYYKSKQNHTQNDV
jgi:hypothetical protein